MRHPFVRQLTLVVGILVVLGCSSEPRRNPVTGTVTYKKEPISAGIIQFYLPDGGIAGGASINAGKYEIPAAAGLLAGKYKVSISYPDPKTLPPEEKAGEAPGMGGQASAGKQPRDLLPKKYNEESTLTAEITDGNNTIPFDLD